MLGDRLSKHTVTLHRSNVWKIRCHERSKREERWTTTVTRSTWIIYSLRMRNRMQVCSNCYKLHTNGNRHKRLLLRMEEQKCSGLYTLLSQWGKNSFVCYVSMNMSFCWRSVVVNYKRVPVKTLYNSARI